MQRTESLNFISSEHHQLFAAKTNELNRVAAAALNNRKNSHPASMQNLAPPKNLSVQPTNITNSANDPRRQYQHNHHHHHQRQPSIVRLLPIRHSLLKLNHQISTDNLTNGDHTASSIKHPEMRIKPDFGRSTKNAEFMRNRKSEIVLNHRKNDANFSAMNVSFSRAQSIPGVHHFYTESHTKRSSTELQRIYIVRHGERVDSTFGVNWIDVVFDRDGKYKRLNLNLPRNIPVRKSVRDFLFDPPLTEIGLTQSKMIGEELFRTGSKIDYCYSSPALRCVQTASKILEGLQRKDISIRIEPCLFEFLKWHPVIPMPNPFMHVDELKRNGYNVDASYRPVYPLESLRKDEDESMFYTRSHAVMLQIINNHDSKRNNILVVGHAPTLEVTTRQLLGLAPRTKDLKILVKQIPYLSLQTIERQYDNQWKLKKPPIPPIKHCALEPFDWKHIR